MSGSERGRNPGGPEMTQAEIQRIVNRIQDELYFGPDNVRVVVARMDERLSDMDARMEERLGNMDARMDERLGNMDVRMEERFSNMGAEMDERFRNMGTEMDKRFRNMDARMEERFRNTASREEIANLKISMIRWFMGSTLTLAGIIVTTFKWLLP